MRKTSIIIPTYNGKHLLAECIQAIRRYTETPYEIIVVDNGSTDGTAKYCQKEEISFISLPENAGFPKACNMGLKLAGGDALLLLNNDVIVTRGWLNNMLDCLDSGEDVGIVGPTTNYASGQQKVDVEFTDIEHFQQIAALNNRPDPDKRKRVERIVGLCFLFKRELMERIGILDERFSPGHYEDDDYCYRARLAGYRLMISEDVLVYHHGSASFKHKSLEELTALVNRNQQKFIDKWGVNPHDFI